jgi:oligopeptide transport system substrate-binding protein
VDRGRYRDISAGDNALLAQGLYPPALPGFDAALAAPPADPAAARQFLADSSYGGPAGLPPLLLSTAGLGGDMSSGVGAMIRMWQENLGVSVTVEQIEPGQLARQAQSSDRGSMVLWSWCADYPDPENFADVLFHSQSGQNIGRYSDPALDALLERARVEPDGAARIGLYQQAERMILDGAPAIFLTHPLSRVYVKPRVRGFAQSLVPLPFERQLSIEPPAAPAAQP